MKRMGRVAWPSSCSRSAHDKNVLVRRAQSRIDQATLENEMGNWEDTRNESQPDSSLMRRGGEPKETRWGHRLCTTLSFWRLKSRQS